jgi:phosphatidylinositol glycan class O
MSTDKLDPEEVRRRLMQQNSARFQIRNNKLRFISILYFIIFLSITILQTISVAFFTRGFLLSRQVLDNYSTLDDDIFTRVPELHKFEKSVIIVIDALRFDFVIPDESSSKPYHNNIHLPYQTSINHPENSVLLKFIADPPTTTLQRLKGLTTGSLPTFVDAGSNFNGDVIEEDNFIKQLHQHDKNITFVGDDTWDALFRPFFNSSYPYDSLNVWDLHTVDNGVIEHIIPFLGSNEKKNWDVLIGHLLGVDHVGHRYGPDHFTMIDKQKQMDDFLADVMNEIDDDTLLIVMGDHGMDKTGNHGGDSIDELESTLWLYSKQKRFSQHQDKSVYNITSNGANYREVNQIDLVPTFSLLMGLPIPFNNLGKPIAEVFKNEEELTLANLLALQQLHRYRQNYKSLQEDVELNDKYEELIKLSDPAKFNKEFEIYQNISLERCKDLWARFDMVSISIGIGLFAFSLFILIVYSKIVPSIVISQLSTEIVPSILAMISLFTVITVAIQFILKPSFLTLSWSILLGIAIGIVMGFLIPILDRYSLFWLFLSFRDLFSGFWTLTGCAFAILHAAIFASNSFTIWEDRILSYLLITFGVIAAFKSLEAPKKVDRVMGVYHSISFAVITRISLLITTCRDEQGDKCVPTFKMTWWSIALIFLNSQLLPSIIAAFYNISGSYQSAAPLWNRCFKYILFTLSIYWLLEHIERNQQDLTRFDFIKNIDVQNIHFLKFTLARILFGITLVAANFGWSRGPLCVKLDIKNTETSTRQACILGYENVYGSQYFLLVMNFISLILIFTKPLGQISIFFLTYQILALSELVEILQIRSNLISPVIFGLLGAFHFFTTGHQATIPSISWELGFSLTENIVFPFSHIPIALNTFGSFIIVGVSVALISLWKIPPSFKPVSLVSKIAENCGTLLSYQSCVTLSSLIFATVFRRHLMVWKIFAPRFMMASLAQIVLNLVIVLITIGFGSTRLILQINRVFGK